MPGSTLLISPALRQQMQEHVTECLPEEACGLLGGQGGRAEIVLPVENVLHSPSRFRMEPSEQIRAMTEIEQRGLELMAIYHSHPSGPEVLSATDLAELAYPEAIYLHEGETFFVHELDLEKRIARVKRVSVDYYTQPVLDTSIRVTGEHDDFIFGDAMFAQ